MSFFSSNLRFLRNSKHLSQDAFARAVGMNRGNIASYEKGLAEPSSARLLTIARFFGAPLEAIIEDDFRETGLYFLENQANTRSALTAAEYEELKVEALRLDRIISGLREFQLIREAGEELSARDIQSLVVDHERLLDASLSMQSLIRRLIT